MAIRRRWPTRTPRACPGATVERIAGAGHWPWLDRPRGGGPRRGATRGMQARRLAAPSSPVAARLPTLTAAVIAAAYVIISPPQPGPGRAPAARQAVLRRGLRAVEQLVVRGPQRPGLQRAVPTARGAADAAARRARSPCRSRAALFESLAHRRFGDDAWLGALWFGSATATSLFTGRLTFALRSRCRRSAPRSRSSAGDPASRPRWRSLTALASPVAALFAALAGAAQAVGAYRERAASGRAPGHRRDRGAAALPSLALAIAFPEGGTEPFAFSAFWPIVADRARRCCSSRSPRTDRRSAPAPRSTRSAASPSFASPSPVGSNVARLGAAPGRPARRAAAGGRGARLALVAVRAPAAVPPVAGAGPRPPAPRTTTARSRPPTSSRCCPSCSRQPGPPFRIEIPFTLFHWEAYVVAPAVPARPRMGAPARHQVQRALLRRDADRRRRYDAWLHAARGAVRRGARC